MQHLDIRVSCIVQGVFFRTSTKEISDHLDINGWVMNHNDGSVRIEAEGDATAMQQFCEWLQQGPEGAVVENVEASSGPVQNYVGFFIK